MPIPEPLRPLWEDTQIAHSDYDALIKQHAYALSFAPNPPIEPATQQEVQEALKCLASFMNGMEGFLTREVVNDQGNTNRTVTAYDLFCGDTEAVVQRMKESMRYRQLIEDGRIQWVDFNIIEGYG